LIYSIYYKFDEWLQTMKKVTIDDPKGGKSETSENGRAKNEEDNGPSATDLVIRDGFPALRLPGTNFKPNIDGEETIPRHSFWTSEDAITFHPDHLESLRMDCETVFTARDKPDGQAYSAGQTFFIPASMKPRCALEAMALTIFEKHVQHLEEGTYNPEQSGANWWTLVMDDDDNHKKDEKDDDEEEGEEDEVALHFDADYELEEQVSHIYPTTVHPLWCLIKKVRRWMT
jgi:hypothetical protein